MCLGFKANYFGPFLTDEFDHTDAKQKTEREREITWQEQVWGPVIAADLIRPDQPRTRRHRSRRWTRQPTNTVTRSSTWTWGTFSVRSIIHICRKPKNRGRAFCRTGSTEYRFSSHLVSRLHRKRSWKFFFSILNRSFCQETARLASDSVIRGV